MVKYSEDKLTQVFSALSDPTRREILKLLGSGSLSVQDLAEPFSMSLPAVSKHLKILEKAHLVSRQVLGRVHQIQLQPDALKTVQDWLNYHCNFWQGSLDRFKQFIENQKDEDDDKK